MIVVGVMIVSFLGGFFAAVLCLGVAESEMQYREARKVARRMDGHLR